MTISNKLQIGSSETTREILITQFYLLDYILFGTPQHKPNPNPSFLEWFIGFFEYQGFFLKWFDQKQKNRFALEIINKDVQLLMKIRKELGFGTIVKQKNDIYWRYSVNDFKDCKRLIWLFNGNLITVKKQKQFLFWLNLFNKRYKTEILFSKTKPDICFKNAWLSGFFEALGLFFVDRLKIKDAGFWVKSKDLVRFYKNYSQSSTIYPLLYPFTVKMIFYIYQRDSFEYVNKVKELLQISDEIYQISSNLFSSIDFTSLLKTHLLLSQYLTKYPFLGKGEILFNRWKRFYGYHINKYPITKKSFIKLQRLLLNTKKSQNCS